MRTWGTLRHRPWLSGLFSLLATWTALEGSARGEPTPSPCQEPRLSPCIDTESFWPHGAPGPFPGLAPPSTLSPWAFSAGVVASYQSRPLLLQIPSPAPTGRTSYAVDDQLTTSLIFALGLWPRWGTELALPITLYQRGDGLSGLSGGTPLGETAFRDLRWTLATTLLPGSHGVSSSDNEGASPWSLGLRSALGIPTGEGTEFAGSGGWTWAPSAVAQGNWGPWVLSAELGARVRATRELQGFRMGPQGVIALGGGFHVFEDAPHLLSFGLELRTLPILVPQRVMVNRGAGLESAPGGSMPWPTEWLLSAQSAPLLDGDLGFQLGVGTGLPLSGILDPTAPIFRMVFGMAYTPGRAGRDPTSRGSTAPPLVQVPPAPEAPPAEPAVPPVPPSDAPSPSPPRPSSDPVPDFGERSTPPPSQPDGEG